MRYMHGEGRKSFPMFVLGMLFLSNRSSQRWNPPETSFARSLPESRVPSPVKKAKRKSQEQPVEKRRLEWFVRIGQ